jgi:cell division protein FtsA
LSDIFDLIDDHLRRIDRNGLLPAGIILTGGGSELTNIEELAKIALKLPSKQSALGALGNTKQMTNENEWSVAYGLAILGLGNDDNSTIEINLGRKLFEKTSKSIWGWIKQFLP